MIYVGGISLAQGYQKLADQTSRAFVRDPHGGPDDLLYRTGDIGFFESDGRLRIVGRTDGQVKILGYRVEVGEIDGVLRECPGVDESAVLLTESRKGHSELVAIYVSSSGLAPHALEKHARALLPGYMVPRRFMARERIPRISMGKLDVTSLKKLMHQDLPTEQESPPDHALEHNIIAIWQRVLGLDTLQREDNFFEIGGHSLLAAQLISRLSHELGRQVPLRYLFEHPTVAGLADRLQSDDGSAPWDEVVHVCTQERTERVPLSYAQQRVWFMDRFSGSMHFYNMHRTWHIRGIVNVNALESAFTEMVNRHEVLRTVFAESGGELFQSVRTPGNFHILQIDASNDDEELALRMKTELARPFDLSVDLLVRACLFTCRDGYRVLMVIIHHIASDAWSMSILFRELEPLIGFFSNTLVLRDRLAGQESFSSLPGRVRKTCLEAYEHQDLPFDRLVESLQPDRDPGRHQSIATTAVWKCSTTLLRVSLSRLRFCVARIRRPISSWIRVPTGWRIS
jgi:acyl carrier protein